MQPMSDDELGNAVGQAFFQIDRTEGANGFDFTRFTFGLDVDVSLNADLVEFGRYPRAGETAPSDIRISDFALGSIENGVIKPFSIKDPFFELAFERNSQGGQDLVGVRVGFGEAQGKLSGNIESLTGNLEVDVIGTARPIYDVASLGQRALLLLAGVTRDTVLSTDAVLQDENGNRDEIRAQWVGVENGVPLNCDSGCNLGGLTDVLLNLFKSDNCQILGIQTCFRLNTFRTLDIQKADGSPATGMFLSLQTKTVSWVDGNGSINTPAAQGAFLNIPNGGIKVDFEQSFNGTQRVQTKFVDPYY